MDFLKYILNWADTNETKDLRWTYEHLLIEKRREIQISTFEEAKQFYEFIHGCGKPPISMRRNVFTQNYNNMPNWECSIQGPDPV